VTQLADREALSVPQEHRITAPTKTLKIIHASGEVFDNDDQAEKDLKDLIDLEPVILCGTESGNLERQRMMRRVLDEAGYHNFVPGQTDGFVAIHRNLVQGATITARYDEVLPAAREVGDPHPYNGKGVIQMQFYRPDLGRITVVGGGHYLTKGRFPGQEKEDAPHDPVDHRAANRELARAMANACLDGSEGQGISFFTADTNMVDREDDVFFGKPLTTCWDELGKWPDTGHGNIDVIGSVNSDGRVRCAQAYVLDDEKFPQFSDHFVVVAKYEVRKLVLGNTLATTPQEIQ
jgi:hypothetical protein